jgi:ubiquinol-cytochrome c reductase cytochrome b subunit
VRILKQVWCWFDDVTGISAWLVPIMRHPVPHARRTAWFYVLGSSTLFVFILQIVTGIALASSYVASTAQAYNTLLFISGTTFGRIVRGIHAFGASAMVILIGVHAIRVYLMGATSIPDR